MYKRTKTLSSTISEFYERHCTSDTYLNVTQEYVLSYENAISKLDTIFQHFEDMKRKIGSSREITPYNHVAIRSLTQNDDKGQKPADHHVRYRSKSPSPYNQYNMIQDSKRLIDLEFEVAKQTPMLNKCFKKNVTHI